MRAIRLFGGMKMVCWHGGEETGNLANEEANPINLKAAVDLNAEA